MKHSCLHYLVSDLSMCFTIADNEGPCCQLPVGAPSRFLSSIFQFLFEAWETTIINTAAIRSLSIVACAMIASDVDDISAAVSYREIWAQHIYPIIQPVYDELKLLPSTRMTAKQTEREKKDKKEHKANVDIIHHKLSTVMIEVRDNGER